MRFLLDENLSPRLVPRIGGLGAAAEHIAHLGRTGLSDAALFRRAFAEDQVVVTINAADFLTLAAGIELHPGLVVLRVSGLSADEQWAHLEPAPRDCVRREEEGEPMINTVVGIGVAGRFRRYRMPPEG